MSEHLQRALVLIDLGRTAQAAKELRHELAQRPNNPTAHQLLASCLAKQGQLPQARAEAEEAVRLQPDSDEAHLNLGRILLQLGKWKEAEEAHREAIRLAPRDSDLFFFLAYLFAQQERWSDSAEAAHEGLRLDAENVPCAKILAKALIYMNRLGEAQEILKVAMAKEPEEEWGHTVQGLLYQKQNKLEASLHHFQEAARINPENTSTHETIKSLVFRINFLQILVGLPILLFILFHVINFIIDVINFIVWRRRPEASKRG